MRQALPTMASRSTNPQNLESWELLRLSPSTKYLPSGTVSGPWLRTCQLAAPGSPATIFTNDDPSTLFETTDDDGDAAATYKSPLSAAFVGDEDFPRMIVGAGDEVGNPVPRVTLPAITMNVAYEMSATVSAPASLRQYLEDPSDALIGETG